MTILSSEILGKDLTSLPKKVLWGKSCISAQPRIASGRADGK